VSSWTSANDYGKSAVSEWDKQFSDKLCECRPVCDIFIVE